MIIWGSTGREKTIAQGQFFCPHCMQQRAYEHRKVSRYFTLYFIPLFSLEDLGEYVRCDGCAGEFQTHVAEWTEAQVLALTQPWACGACGNHNPSRESHCLGCSRPRGS
ncbi:MAG: zinc-ribbon domain-containing protein [Sandaracinus sp.]|nr:zinc-ribbon domain-containing protein [Sandaracinus sp.]